MEKEFFDELMIKLLKNAIFRSLKLISLFQTVWNVQQEHPGAYNKSGVFIPEITPAGNYVFITIILSLVMIQTFPRLRNYLV